jgi:hypothetical protein
MKQQQEIEKKAAVVMYVIAASTETCLPTASK